MKKNKFMDLLSSFGTGAKKKSPEILAGMAIIGIATSVYAGYKAGLKASKILDEYNKEMSYVEKDDKEASKVVKIKYAKKMAPVVLPPIIMGITSSICVLSSNRISSKRIAVLSTVYTAAEKTVKDLEKKTEELLGDKKLEEIRGSIIKDKIEEKPVKKDQNVIITGCGDVLCKDLYTGVTFRSSSEKIRQAVNTLSADCQQEMYVSLDDFYDILRIPPEDRGSLMEDIGWNIDDLYRGQLPIHFTSVLTSDDTPCLGILYDVKPSERYRELLLS